MALLPVRTPRRAAAAALVALVLLAPSPADARQPQTPAQDAAVEGVVTHQDGSPAEGVPVRVVGYDDPGLVGALTLVFSLGLACIADFSICGGDSTGGTGATTGADGGYHGSLPGSYVAGTETDTDWTVTATLPPAAGQVRGPSSAFEFEVNIALQAAPPLPLWEQTPSFSVDGWEATVSVDGRPPAGTGETTVAITTTGGTISVPGSSATVDLRRLEAVDSDPGTAQPHGYATAYADVRVPHANGRTIYHQAVTTGVVALPPVDLTPPSRWAPCSIVTTDGTVTAMPRERCAATDGRRSGFGATGTASVTVELESPVEVADVFVVGCLDHCTVEASADGATWTALTNGWTDASSSAASYNDLLVASPAAPLASRFVRVSAPGGIEDVTEVSVWPGPAALVPPTTVAPVTVPAPVTVGISPTAPVLPAPHDDGGGGTSTASLAVVAVVALAVAGGAVAIAMAKGRRQG